MPLPPLRDPEDPIERLQGISKGFPIATFLWSSLICFNAAQTGSLAVRPFSRHAFRRFNRWSANTWWSWCLLLAKGFNGARIVVSGDLVPSRENAIVVVNHQQMPDITFLMDLAQSKHRLGDMKWFVKDALKYVPGVGWGMLFLDCLFVKRNWADDAKSIEKTFASLRDEKVPVWLISFVEGTRATPEKIQKSQQYAKEYGLPILEHVQIPRTKGFIATVQGLRGHVAAIYDITIGYKEGVPTLWQYVKGVAQVAHLHVRRFPLEDVPADEQELKDWLRERFVEKDRLLETFYRSGRFPE